MLDQLEHLSKLCNGVEGVGRGQHLLGILFNSRPEISHELRIVFELAADFVIVVSRESSLSPSCSSIFDENGALIHILNYLRKSSPPVRKRMHMRALYNNIERTPTQDRFSFHHFMR